MTNSLVRQHLFRAWRQHWALQIASVTVMTMVLMGLNTMFLGFSIFRGALTQWGQGLEMVVFLRESATPSVIGQFEADLRRTGEFEQIQFTSKTEATNRFLKSLGTDSLDLLNDPKWSSPIPASFDLKLSGELAPERRVAALHEWSAKLRNFEFVEDVFFGQGWIENFSRFLVSARGLMAFGWLLSMAVGLLIVSNCIRLSFLQRRDEIEVLELVGATPKFIRIPFLLEGLVIGAVASVVSIALSYGLHVALLAWLGERWNFWLSIQTLSPLPGWTIAVNLLTGMTFGALGAWNCVRKLNTGWSAVG